MSSGSSKPGIRTPDPTASLPDDILVDILSRLPVKSLCRCKAVSRRWRSLIAHDDNRRTLARTLPGLFYGTRDSKRSPAEARHFTHVWEGDRRPLVPPSLSFLPAYCEDITVLGCVNGVLLCRFSETDSQDDNFRFRYVVCNPVDKRRLVLPDSGCGAKNRVAFLAFDPSLYPDVHVFEFVMDEEDNLDVVGANIYSHETRAWSYKQSGWDPEAASLFRDARCVFFNGLLHIVSSIGGEVLVVDVEGDTWFTIYLPVDAYFETTYPGFIGTYKGQFCYVSEMEETYDVAVWVLEDYRKDDWTMKHRLDMDMLFEKQHSPYTDRDDYYVIGILQDCNSILYVAGRTLMAYDIDGEEVHAIQKLERGSHAPYFLYLPFYTE